MIQALLPKTDPTLRETRVAGARLTFTDEGASGGAVFFALHGVPGSVRDFRYLAPQIAPFARFIRVDLPGSGGSEPRLEALRSMEARARTLFELADQLKISSFGVIGHSMGGGSALVAAAMAPDRVTRLVLLASMGLRPHRGLSRSRGTFRRIAFLLRIPGLRHLVLPQVRKHYRMRRFPRVDAMTAHEYALQFEAFSAVDFALLNRTVRKRLPAKTLIAFAEDDHLVETQIGTQLAESIPGSQILRFEEGGHNIQKTRAAEIALAIRDS